METLFEILIAVFPAIITGLFSFLITKYTYNRNVPLDKLEISYSRVYYPLYRFLKGKSIDDYNDIIDKINFYFRKYEKYVDRSTLIAFRSLCECNSDAKKKDSLLNLKENIRDRNYYLRRRLGYLEPNFLQMYKYSSKADKSTFRILMEFCVLYIALVLGSNTTGNIQVNCLALSIVALVIIFFEFVCRILIHLYYKFKK